MTTIETKHIGPTNTRGARIRATALATKQYVILDWNHAISATENHQRAAETLIRKMDWYGHWTSGDGRKGTTIFVCTNHADAFDIHQLDGEN